jgi:hypothetical protein
MAVRPLLEHAKEVQVVVAQAGQLVLVGREAMATMGLLAMAAAEEVLMVAAAQMELRAAV